MISGDGKQGSVGLRVLVAEDGKVNQQVAIRLLDRMGHAVTVVDNGKQAVEAVRRSVFDVLLMDVEMPELDGLSATRLIRASEHDWHSPLPIVGVTANDNREECLNAGMNAYLPKPLERQSLSKMLESILRRTVA
jgi:CheY-like chemotaxis protein